MQAERQAWHSSWHVDAGTGSAYRSGEELETGEGLGVGRGRGIRSLQGHHEDQEDEEQDDVEHKECLQEDEVGEDTGAEAAADLLQGVVPGLRGGEQGEEPVPEAPAALGRESLGRAPGPEPVPEPPTAAVQTRAPDLRGRCSPWTIRRERRGPGAGRAAAGGPSARSAPACPAQRGVRGWRRPRDGSGCGSPAWPGPAGEDLPEGTFLCQAEGHGEQHVAALAGREAQQLLHQQTPLVWGHKGLSRMQPARTRHARPEPGTGTVPGTACPQGTLTFQCGPGGVGLQVVLPQAGPRGAAELLQGWAAAPAPQPGRAVVVLGDDGPTAAPCG